MRLSTLPLISLLAASVSAGNLFQQLAGNQVSLTGEPKNIPGQNPLQYCTDDPSGDALIIEEVDLTPNPPVPCVIPPLSPPPPGFIWLLTRIHP